MKYNYYVFIVKQQFNGEYEHDVQWVWDTDPATARLKGEAKWHENCALAALSTLPQYSVTLLTSDGRSIAQKSYTHAIQPETTPETEPVSE